MGREEVVLRQPGVCFVFYSGSGGLLQVRAEVDPLVA